MTQAVSNFELSRQYGALARASTIRWDGISAHGLLRVLSRLTKDEVRQLRTHLDIYERSGQATEYLLGVLALASGRKHKSTRRAMVLDLQPDVVGLVFS